MRKAAVPCKWRVNISKVSPPTRRRRTKEKIARLAANLSELKALGLQPGYTGFLVAIPINEQAMSAYTME
jgi:hypothetical protein